MLHKAANNAKTKLLAGFHQKGSNKIYNMPNFKHMASHKKLGKSRTKNHARRLDLQTAIEYLTVYGWALLIIAVIFIAFFQLNIFSNNSLRAAPGSCKVIRLNGPYTTGDINTEGFCQNLPPQTVADFSMVSSLKKGKGNSSYPSFVEISSPFNSQIQGQVLGFTITSWVYWYGGNSANCQGIFSNVPGPSSGIGLYAYGGNNGACGPLWINGSFVKWPDSNQSIPSNRWVFVSATYNESNGTAAVYINNTLFSHATITKKSFLTTNSATIGADIWPSGSVYSFNGLVTNVQLYDAPLPSAEMTNLYREGIGGDPIDLLYLVGWWPLNGDSIDYSGNGNNGVAYNLTGTASYTIP